MKSEWKPKLQVAKDLRPVYWALLNLLLRQAEREVAEEQYMKLRDEQRRLTDEDDQLILEYLERIRASREK